MAINTRVTRPIAITPDRYQGVSAFQERALVNAQNKIDAYNKSITDNALKYGVNIKANVNDVEKAKALTDSINQDVKGLTANRLQDIDKTKDQFYEFNSKWQNNADVKTINERATNISAYEQAVANNPDKDKFLQEAALNTRNTELTNPDGSYNTNPVSDLNITTPLNGVGAAQELFKGLKGDIVSSAEGSYIDFGGIKVPMIKQGTTETLDKNRLSQMALETIKNTEQYAERVKTLDRWINNPAINYTEEDKQAELNRLDNQIKAVAQGTSYEQGKFNFNQLDTSKLGGNNTDSNATTQEEINRVISTTYESSIHLNANPSIAGNVSKFQNEYTKNKKGIETIVNNVSVSDENGSYKPIKNNNGQYEVPKLGSSIYDIDGNKLPYNESNELISNMKRHNVLTTFNDKIIQKTKEKLSIGEDAYKKHQQFIEGDDETKATILGYNNVEEYNKAFADWKRTVNSQSGSGFSKGATKAEFNTLKYRNVDNNFDIGAFQSEFNTQYALEKKNQAEKIDFSFKDFNKLNSTQENNLTQDLADAYGQDGKRQEMYDNIGFNILQNATSVIGADGKAYNVNEEGLFLEDDLEPGDIGAAIPIKPFKITQIGYDRNPQTGNTVEAISVVSTEGGEAQILYVEEPLLNEISATIGGYGSQQELESKINKSIYQNGGTYFEDGPYGGFTITKLPNNKYDVIIRTSDGRTVELPNKPMKDFIGRIGGLNDGNAKMYQQQRQSSTGGDVVGK